MKPCLLVPIYNHKDTIAGVLRSLAPVCLPALVVDDGSDGATRHFWAGTGGEPAASQPEVGAAAVGSR